jgi:ElaB/YqjD/DUF883 family membrane-anchored ribosome-binding protein
MNDAAEGSIANAGEAVQRQVNRADEAVDEISTFVRGRPITALLIAVGVGYILGKIV